MYYHVWFLTKYRKSVLEGKIDKSVKNILEECIHHHDYKVLEFETNKDHIHILVEADSKKDLSSIMRVLKAVSSKEILNQLRSQDKYRDAKHFWAKRYGFKEIESKNIEYIREYIRNQH